MKISLVGHGTRGDVQPHVCLAVELQRRGHEVRVIAPRNMERLVRLSGVDFFASDIDVEAEIKRPSAQRMLADGRVVAFLRFLQERDEECREPLHASWIEGLAGTEAIIGHPMAEDVLAAVAAHLRVPLLTIYFGPFLPTRELPSLLFQRSWGLFNPLSHRLLNFLIRRTALEPTNAMRRRLGVRETREIYREQVGRRKLPVVFSYSAHVAPRPSDYAESVEFCDGVVPDAELKRAWGEEGLPAELEDWLDAGPPPFFIGFGSMPVLDPEGTLAMTQRVLRRLGQRAVIGAGWSGLQSRSDQHTHVVEGVDHAALFARCRGAVHHGGAGTTYASLRAGLPTLVASVFADQPFWGARVAALGVGRSIPFSRLTEATLERELVLLSDEGVTLRAAELGEKLRQERGVTQVASCVERRLPHMPAPD